MKKTIKYLLLLAVACATMTGCSLWEDTWSECNPLPGANPEITPDPWEPPVTDDDPVGK